MDKIVTVVKENKGKLLVMACQVLAITMMCGMALASSYSTSMFEKASAIIGGFSADVQMIATVVAILAGGIAAIMYFTATDAQSAGRAKGWLWRIVIGYFILMAFASGLVTDTIKSFF